MLIDKPMCNFKNCRYCFDGNCRDASKYENCTLTDLHSEIARLRVDLDNAKADIVRKMQERFKKEIAEFGDVITVWDAQYRIDQIAKEMLEGVESGS